MKEGRATLMGLRRAVAGTAGRGRRFLSLTDNRVACWPLIGVALAAVIYSVCVAVQLLCALALLCRRFFGTWRPGVILHMKDLDETLGLVVRGLCGGLPSHLLLNMFLGFWVFKFVSTKNRWLP